MANLFNQNQLSQHKSYEQKYKNARSNLWLVVLFTAINLLLLVTNANTYFLFSAYIPYFLVSAGMLMCGLFPDEYYTEEFQDMPILDSYVFIILLIIAIALTLVYLLTWFMSKKRVGWLIFALVFFGIDTLGLLFLNGITLDSAFDILFHGWVIVSLVIGIRSHYQLKNLPPEEEINPSTENTQSDGEGTDESTAPNIEELPDSTVLRVADPTVKHRVLLSASVLNYDICYRRVKHTNELVINGKVYAEIEGMLEFAHVLQAHINGHLICSGFDGVNSYISVDGETVAKKLRLF